MLTRQQHQLLVFIDRFTRGNGWAPSYDEMRTEMGFASKSGIARLMAALIERGFIAKRFRNRVRAIEVIRLPDDVGPSRPSDAARIRQVAIDVLHRELWPSHVNRMPTTLAPAILDALDAAGLTLVRKP